MSDRGRTREKNRQPKGVLFAEEPATSVEKDVAALLQDYFSALLKKNISIINSCFSTEASICSYVCGYRKVTRKEHLQQLTLKINFIEPICFSGTLIKEKKCDKAFVSTTFLFFTKNEHFGPKRVFFECNREIEGWKITKQWYLD